MYIFRGGGGGGGGSILLKLLCIPSETGSALNGEKIEQILSF